MFTIGKPGALAGVKVPTIRHPEQIGLLSGAERSAGNQRLDGRRALDRLAFMRHARGLGLVPDVIRDRLTLSDRPGPSCAAADAMARAQLAEVENSLARLRVVTAEPKRMVAQYANRRIADCRVIGVPGDHALCAADRPHIPGGVAA